MSAPINPPPAYIPPQPPVNQSQPGYGPAPPYQGYQGGVPPGYQNAPPGYQPVPTTTSYVYVRGGSCPACGIGVPNPEFTILGICLAIFFFPLGILCCLALTERKCSHCGMTFG